ncbi:MAG TPA: L-2-hydroxyglutarate oxidase [Dehalococcoidia bacterium]|nr:L-2-hydroxyglutarate oxidase [Dehalococcoidia bacterium]
MATATDVTIVGAGIVGLATARELLIRHPSLRLTVLEKEQQIGTHQTGHNSGVIHSGIYYAPGSLKAKLCVEGGQALRQFCDEHGINFERCGKVIVATEPSELGRLDDLHQRGIANSVPGLEMIGPERLRELEPHAAGIKALYSPNTSIIDFSRVAAAYAVEVQEKGGEILTGREVVGIKASSGGLVVQTKLSEVKTRHVITCGGLYSDRLAAMTGASPDPRIVPFRGDYWVLRGERRELVRGLIYPVPDPSLPFLGVHFTKRHDGAVWAGPNAVLAFSREGYGRLDVNLRDNVSLVRNGGFWRMAKKYWRTGLDELYRDYRKTAFLHAMQRYVPEVRSEDVEPGPSGVRAQALDSDGRLVDDFAISQNGNAIHVRNAPSPAATSSLAIAVMIVDRADEAFSLAAA